MNVQSANRSGWLTSRPHPSEAIHRGDTHTHTQTTWQHSAHRLDLLSNDLCRGIVAQLNFLFFFPFSSFNPCIIPMEWRSAKVPKVFSCFPPFFFFLCSPTSFLLTFGKRRPFPRNKIDSTTRVYSSSSPFFLFIIIFALYACCFSATGKDAYTGGNNYPTQTQKRMVPGW
jgi:hypothetical protein